MTDGERENILEEYEEAKEQKRRQELMKQAEKEKLERRRKIRKKFNTAADSAVKKGKKAGRKINSIKAQAAVTLSEKKKNLVNARCKSEEALYSASDKISLFAGKKYSLPVLSLIAFACYIAATYAFGYKPFGLSVNPATYQFYVCDFSVGFCSRLLLGAVISLFADKVSLAAIQLIVNSAVMLSLVMLSVVAGAALKLALKNKSMPALVIAAAFVVSPLVSVANMSAAGLLDVYLLIMFLVWLSLIKTPLCAVLTPIVCLAGMTVHYEFLFAFLPPMLTLLFYYSFFAETKGARARSTFSFVSGSAVSASSFFYFVFFAKDHLKMTSDEFYLHMLSRFDISRFESETLTGIMGAPLYRNYFDYYIFGQYRGNDYFGNISDFFIFLKNWSGNNFNREMFIKDMNIFMPVFMFCAVFWVVCIIREKGIKKLPFIFFIGQALVLVPELIISTDLWRWFSAALISQFTVFFTVYADEGSPLRSAVAAAGQKRPVRAVSAVWLICYSAYAVSLL